jgi:hypothetical protein
MHHRVRLCATAIACDLERDVLIKVLGVPILPVR